MAEDHDRSTISKAKLLAVEGDDEVNLFTALTEHEGLTDIEIRNVHGKTRLRSYVDTVRGIEGFYDVACLGVVRDADDNPQAAFDSASGALRDAGLAVPAQPETFEAGRPRTGILIFPRAGLPGMLEDLCWESVQADPAAQCVTAYMTCVQGAVGLPRIVAKARVQAFLASREESDLRLGLAARKGYWPWDNPAWDHVKNFLHSM